MHANRHSLRLFGILGAVFFAAAPASAQCTDQWLPGQGLPGLNGTALAAVVYDDGTGPALYVGGLFTIAGEAIANNIARWDGTNWSPLGSGMNSGVGALTVYNGELIAAGAFTTADGTSANYIARWDGTSWSPLGSGMNDFVLTLTVYNGELIAGGNFYSAGGTFTNFIARWDGSTWSPLGSGMNERVRALTGYNDELIAGGSFDTAGEHVSAYWARWGPDVPLGDLDGDCTVGATDLDILLATWGLCADCELPGDCPADLDGNCTVGVVDLLILLGNWG